MELAFFILIFVSANKTRKVMKTRKIGIDELKDLLHNGEVRFEYLKRDGTVRVARGTMKPEVVKPRLKGGKSTVGDSGYTVYYDLDREAFRCFAESRLVGMVEE